ncbi:MAG TPA: hypothetical protein VK084_08820 [Chitinophagaceae bacterium]|nr:hypothetical protein [Chitinophagaceae bacterium]
MKKKAGHIIGWVLLLVIFIGQVTAGALFEGSSSQSFYTNDDQQTESPFFKLSSILPSGAFILPSSEHTPIGGNSLNSYAHSPKPVYSKYTFSYSKTTLGTRLFSLLYRYKIIFPFHSFW